MKKNQKQTNLKNKKIAMKQEKPFSKKWGSWRAFIDRYCAL